jgi:hypothetical protein
MFSIGYDAARSADDLYRERNFYSGRVGEFSKGCAPERDQAPPQQPMSLFDRHLLAMT